MNVHIIRADGREVEVEVQTKYAGIRSLIQADGLDGFRLRDGRYVYVDDNGHERGKPVNAKATALYHSICRPGTTHQIVGDVAIVNESEAA